MKQLGQHTACLLGHHAMCAHDQTGIDIPEAQTTTGNVEEVGNNPITRIDVCSSAEQQHSILLVHSLVLVL